MAKETIYRSGQVAFLAFDHLLGSGICHAFSLRGGGASPPPYDSLNLGFHVGDDPRAVLENRKRLAAALGFSPNDTVAGRQVHGTGVAEVGSTHRGLGAFSDEDALLETDCLITCEPGLVLTAHAADCTIIYFCDTTENWIGLAHAGWRGAVAGVGPAVVEALVYRGCRRENIRVALSPTIGPCCYRVGEEMVAHVPSRWHRLVLSLRDTGLYLDLPELQRLLLVEAGIKEERLAKSSYCTACNSKMFFSHRASGGRTGRMSGVIYLKKRESQR